MQAVILSIGDELVLGQTVDTNSAWLSAQLAQRGIGTLYHQTVADDCEAVRWAIELAAQRSPLVIVSGGLGPTDDDLTRQALAAALGVELVLHQRSLEAIANYFAERGRAMGERNRIQAMHPAGTRMMPNTCGTAPGIAATLGQSRIYIVPGVPREMIAMFELAIAPELEASMAERAAILTTKINTFGYGESTIAERLGELMARDRNPTVGTTVSDGVVSVRVRSEFADRDEAARQLEATAAEVQRRLGAIVYGRDDHSLQEAVVRLICERQLKLTTAESCTGGLVGAMITDVPGCSGMYVGGWVTYANEMKMQELGVDKAMLDEHGAVSRAVACAMVEGALRQSGADIAVSITGIAGPDGGTPEKPVGTVWIGVGDRQQVRAMHFQFAPAVDSRLTSSATGAPASAAPMTPTVARDLIRDRSARCALQMLRLHVLGVSLAEIHWGKEA